MHAWEWQPEERAILRALAVQVRLMSFDQISRAWFGDATSPIESARHAVRQLEGAGLVQRHIFEAHPLLPLVEPLLKWTPQERDPSEDDFQDVSRTATTRWTMQEQPIEAVIATPAACHLFGTFRGTGLRKSCETTHDLHVAEIFVLYLRQDPALAANWLGENAFPKLGLEIKRMKDPDALIVEADGTLDCVIEFAGKYDAQHLAAIHQHCAGKAHDRLARSVPAAKSPLALLYPAAGTEYEIW